MARALTAAGHAVIGVSRQSASQLSSADIHSVPDLTDINALAAAFSGCDIIFHFADRADRKSYARKDIGAAADVLKAIRTAAMQNGISRIVAFSSVYANRPESANDRYGRSKRAMEAVGLAPAPGVPAIIFRLPPLYGPGARGAVRHIARAIENGWPLPFSLARAPRRFLSLDDLADLCAHVTDLDNVTFDRGVGNIWVPVARKSGSLAAVSHAIGGQRTRLLPVPGIDRLLGGYLPRGQLERDQDELVKAIGWRSPG